MNAHVYVDYNEAAPKPIYDRVRIEWTGPDGHRQMRSFGTGNPIRDWYQMKQLANTLDMVVIMGSSLTHFLFDMPGYRTVERPDGEFIVWDDRDGEPSPRDFDWSMGITHGWDITGIASDGWPKGWKRGNRHAWRVVAQPEGKPRGIYWRTADIVDDRFTNHAYHDTQEQAFARN